MIVVGWPMTPTISVRRSGEYGTTRICVGACGLSWAAAGWAIAGQRDRGEQDGGCDPHHCRRWSGVSELALYPST